MTDVKLSPARHESRLDRAAAAVLAEIWSDLVDTHGRPTFGVRNLIPERAIDNFPRLSELRWFSNVTWCNLGTGDRGDGVISLIEWLSGAPRDKCAAFLERTLAAREISLQA